MSLRPRTLWTTLAIAVPLLAALIWAFLPRPPEVETAAAHVGRFEAGVDALARTRVRERYLVSAPLAGRVSRIALREGDAVQRDAVVATLSPALSPMLDARTEAELAARLEAGGANIDRAQARIARARVVVEEARGLLRRYDGLRKGGYVSAQQLDSQRLAVDAARRELAAAEQERHVAEHERDIARAALSAARGGPQAERALALRAPVSGRVLRVMQDSAAPVAIGTPLLEIGDLADLEVVAELLTEDALRAAPGTPVRIVDWGGDAPLDGRVRRVEPGAYTKVSALGVEEQRVEVRIDLVGPRAQWAALGDGYRAGVRVLTQVADGALQVPVSALFPAPGAVDPQAMAVFRIDDGRARLTPVEVLGRNDQSAWIRAVKGQATVQAGTEVIVYPGESVEDGGRVRIRRVAPAGGA